MITSYEIIMRDMKELRRIAWKFVIIDEGHRLKNMNCRLIKELKAMCGDNCNRLLLTGTPLQNNLTELWSLLNFLLPNIFDDLDSFQAWFDFDFTKDDNEQKASSSKDGAAASSSHQRPTGASTRRRTTGAKDSAAVGGRKNAKKQKHRSSSAAASSRTYWLTRTSYVAAVLFFVRFVLFLYQASSSCCCCAFFEY